MKETNSAKIRAEFNKIRALNIPHLTAEQEANLIMSYKVYGCVRSGQRVVEAHLPLAVKYVQERFSKMPYSANDMIQLANLGLMDALRKFNPDKNARFSTYAMFWMKDHVLKGINGNLNVVNIGRSRQIMDVVRNLSKSEEKIRRRYPNWLQPQRDELIAEDLGVGLEMIKRVRALRGGALSLNTPVANADGNEEIEFMDVFESHEPSPYDILEEQEEREDRLEMLRDAITSAGLSKRDLHIFTNRRLVEEPMTLEALGEIHDISKERVRQIEVRVFEKIQAAALSARGSSKARKADGVQPQKPALV